MLRNGVRLSASVALLFATIGFARADGPWDYKLSLDFRARGEDRNNFDFNGGIDDHRSDGLGRFRAGAHVWNKDQGVGFFLQVQESYDQFNMPTFNDNTHQFDLYQAGGEFKFADRWSVKAGRQELSFGDERLVGNNDWSNFGRSWDAVRVDYTGKTHVTVFGGDIAIDGPNPLGNHPTLAGAYTTWALGHGSLDAYYFYKKQAMSGGDEGISTLGAKYDTKWGKMDFSAEAAAQFGKNQDKDVEASAAIVQVEIPLLHTWDLGLNLEGAFASGGDPADSKVKTFDQLFPSNHLMYGVADLQGLRNVRYFGASLDAVPAKNWIAFATYNFFQLDNTKDAWYGDAGGGQLIDPTGSSGRDVGSEFDLAIWYRPSDNWSFGTQWGHFIPGNYVKTLAGDDAADFVSFTVRYRY